MSNFKVNGFLTQDKSYWETQEENEETNKSGKAFIFWLLFSLISAAVLAKFSRGFCAYAFTTLSWTFIWILLIQSWNQQERQPHEIGMLILAGAIGWFIGTFLIWKTRNGFHNGFFENPN